MLNEKNVIFKIILKLKLIDNKLLRNKINMQCINTSSFDFFQLLQ